MPPEENSVKRNISHCVRLCPKTPPMVFVAGIPIGDLYSLKYSHHPSLPSCFPVPGPGQMSCEQSDDYSGDETSLTSRTSSSLQEEMTIQHSNSQSTATETSIEAPEDTTVYKNLSPPKTLEEQNQFYREVFSDGKNVFENVHKYIIPKKSERKMFGRRWMEKEISLVSVDDDSPSSTEVGEAVVVGYSSSSTSQDDNAQAKTPNSDSSSTNNESTSVIMLNSPEPANNNSNCSDTSDLDILVINVTDQEKEEFF